jgi:adenylosuccinate lyase
MRQNLDLTGGLIFSQQVLLALVDAGMDRHDAYRLVQRHALAAWDGGQPFEEALADDPVVGAKLPGDALRRLFDPSPQLRHVDAVFRRLGLLDRGLIGASATGDVG